MNTTTVEIFDGLLASDELMFHNHGTKRLMIWFGGINEPHFNPEVARLANCDFLTFRDITASWYTRGLTSHHENIDVAVSELKKFIEMRGYEKLCFCGQSSGGYGALLYSHLLKADLCIAFSPQTRNMFSGQCQMTPHVRLQDVGELYLTNTETKIILNMSQSEREHDNEFSWNDWMQIDKLRINQNVTVITHPYHNHSVSVKLREVGLLYKLTASLVNAYLN